MLSVYQELEVLSPNSTRATLSFQCAGVTMTNKNQTVWGCISALLFACATLGLLLAQSHGGFGWWVLLIHPRDPMTLWGVLTAPLFTATLYEWVNTTVVMMVVLILGSVHGSRFARDAIIVWLVAGFWVWMFGNSSMYYMGAAFLCYGLCAWLIGRSLAQRAIYKTVFALVASALTVYLLPFSMLCLGPIAAAIIVSRR
jgi:hypothetical protein